MHHNLPGTSYNVHANSNGMELLFVIVRTCIGLNCICFSVVMIYNDSTVVAHAGDGNFHTLVLFDPSKDDQRQEAERLNHLMVRTALSMEGMSSLRLGLENRKLLLYRERLRYSFEV